MVSSLLAETGVRLGEALSLQHQDWRAGRGSTAAIAIVPRPHAHGLIPKSGYRRVYVSAGLDRLCSDTVWALCDRGADALIDDWDSAFIFCNTEREPRYAVLRPESVYAHLRMRKRQLPDLPEQPVLVWFRPKRRAQDAIAEIHLLTSDPCNYEWVVDADIAACLDVSSHCSFG
jgi:hypothetical protein